MDSVSAISQTLPTQTLPPSQTLVNTEPTRMASIRIAWGAPLASSTPSLGLTLYPPPVGSSSSVSSRAQLGLTWALPPVEQPSPSMPVRTQVELIGTLPPLSRPSPTMSVGPPGPPRYVIDMTNVRQGTRLDLMQTSRSEKDNLCSVAKDDNCQKFINCLLVIGLVALIGRAIYYGYNNTRSNSATTLPANNQTALNQTVLNQILVPLFV